MGALLATPLALLAGLAAGIAVAGLLLAAPFVLVWEAIRRRRPRRAPTRR